MIRVMMQPDMLSTKSGSGKHASAALPRFHERVAEEARNRSARAVTIIALGDSVTQGVAEVDHLLHAEVYHARLKMMLEQQHPLTTFNMLNVGVDGDTALKGLARFDGDVADHQPDLVLITFRLNDAFAGGADGVDTFGHTLKTMINRVRSQTPAEMVLITPNMMLTRDNDAVPAPYREYMQPFLEIQTQGLLGRYAQQIRETACEQSIPLADVYHAWEALASRGVDTTAMLSNGLNHPDAEGHALAAHEVFHAIHSDDEVA